MAFDVVAEKTDAKLRLALIGLSGAGKTYSALLMAAELGEAKIGLIDSEHKSAKKHVGEPGIPKFFHESLEDTSPQEYIAKTDEAAEAGAGVLIYDSWSHSWMAALEAVDRMGGNKFSNGWKSVSPVVNKLVKKMICYPGHVIATMRTKAEYVVEKDEKTGKAIPRKIGMAPVAREGTDFEFDFVLELNPDGNVTVVKTRNGRLLPLGHSFPRTDLPQVGRTLKAWLSEGAPVSPRDAMAERIRFAADDAALSALVDDMKRLSEEDRVALRPLYMARKAEFQGAAA